METLPFSAGGYMSGSNLAKEIEDRTCHPKSGPITLPDLMLDILEPRRVRKLRLRRAAFHLGLYLLKRPHLFVSVRRYFSVSKRSFSFYRHLPTSLSFLIIIACVNQQKPHCATRLAILHYFFIIQGRYLLVTFSVGNFVESDLIKFHRT